MDRTEWAEVIECRIRRMSARCSLTYSINVGSMEYHVVGFNASHTFYLGVDDVGVVWCYVEWCADDDDVVYTGHLTYRVGRLEDAGYIGHY